MNIISSICGDKRQRVREKRGWESVDWNVSCNRIYIEQERLCVCSTLALFSHSLSLVFSLKTLLVLLHPIQNQCISYQLIQPKSKLLQTLYLSLPKYVHASIQDSFLRTFLNFFFHVYWRKKKLKWEEKQSVHTLYIWSKTFSVNEFMYMYNK